MQLPNIINDIEKDFDKLIMGIAVEDFEKGWGQVRLFKSFSELLLYQEDQKKQKIKFKNLFSIRDLIFPYYLHLSPI